MRKQDLLNYLNENQSSLELKEEIQTELESYKRSLKEKGRSATIYHYHDGQKIMINLNHLRTICKDYRNGLTDEIFVSYIVDALLLSSDYEFQTEELREKFELLTDFDVDGSSSHNTISHVCDDTE